MHLPVEVIGLIAEHLAQIITQASPFVEPANENKRLQAQARYRDLLNLVITCKGVYSTTRHLLYTCTVLEKPTDVISTLANILKYPQVGPSIRHIRCSTELESEIARDTALQHWLANHAQDTALVQDTLRGRRLHPSWWSVTDMPWTCWDGFVFDDCLQVALVCILYMATELETLSFRQLDSGWRMLRDVRTAFDKDRTEPRPFLGNLRELHISDECWGGIGRWLSHGRHDKLRTLVLDGMSIHHLSLWSGSLRVECTNVRELYLGPRDSSRIAAPFFSPGYDRREWVKGEWLVGCPGQQHLRPEVLVADFEAWGPSVDEVRRRLANLNSFRNLRVLDVVVDRTPDRPFKTLVALKNIAAASLEVFRIEGYPYRFALSDRSPYASAYEAAFYPETDDALG
ncbi:hypothetical protein F66182_5347 [Fusarium sp. NRRL 66182]|nr:hypothetical protein F66182_5347 [Fusarium sp. NRRL 66182]